MKVVFKEYNCGCNPNNLCFINCRYKSCEHCIHRELLNLNDIVNFWCNKHNKKVKCNMHCKYYRKDIKLINGDRI